MFSTRYEALWNDVEVSRRIDEGIDRRREDVSLTVCDDAGKPLPGVRVELEQTSSDYLFGANLFMLGGYPSEELNAGYEAAFLGLFNAGTVPLYWRDLEPEPGQHRFAPDSRPIHRRPPPDSVVAFCRKHQLNMNGHCLLWDFIKWSMPDWYPDDVTEGARLIEKRIREIGERYGDVIQRWDVVNEALLTPERLERNLSRRMPENYERLAFELARKYLPQSAHLMINEAANAWTRHRDVYPQQVRRLMAEGADIRGVGIQLHVFTDEEMQRLMQGEICRPAEMLETLDVLAELRLPIHISEITLTALGNDEAGQRAQARIARNFYRLWFSHPGTHAITWWNLPDGGAAPGEDRVASGLVTREMRPKIAYEVLRELIHGEWRTRTSAETNGGGQLRFRGFAGRYRARAGAAEAWFKVPTSATGEMEIRLPREKIHAK